MKRLLIAGTLLSLLLWGCANPVNVETPIEEQSETSIRGVSEGNNGDIIPGEYIVVFKDKNHPDPKGKVQEVLDKLGVDFSTSVKHVYSHAIQGFAGTIPEGRLNALRNHPSVDYVEPDRIVTIAKKPSWLIDEPDSPDEMSPQVFPDGVKMVGGGKTTSGSRLWIIDTGIDLDHLDLNVDASQSISFVQARNRRKTTTPDDQNGHGTHVAGIAAAIDNDFGVVGVSPGSKVISVRVLDANGSGTYSAVIAGVNHVAANASTGDVVNMSLGGPASEALDDAVLTASTYEDKEIFFTIAAGNSYNYVDSYSPARVNGRNIYTVSACDATGDFANFSNYGDGVDYAEPGVAIESLYKDGEMHKILSGTSMAAPHLAGVLLLGSVRDGLPVNAEIDIDGDDVVDLSYNYFVGIH